MNKGVYYAVFTAILWGFLAVALKIVLRELPPITVTWFRFAISFVLLFIFFLFTNKDKTAILIRPPLLAVAAGISLGLNYIGFITGIHLTNPNIGQIFIQAGPVLLAVAGFVLFNEKLTTRQALGFLAVVVGMYVFYHEKILILAGGDRNYKTGVIWILFGAVCWAAYAVFQKKAVLKHNPMQLNLVLFGLPTLALMPFVEFSKLTELTAMGWYMLIFVGLNTLASYTALAYALKYIEANKISVIITLNPLITLAIMAYLNHIKSSLIVSDTYSFLMMVGTFIVIAGVIMVVFKRKSKKPGII
jgi:drug/metabolite transporter (DMT)-like permease